MKSGNQDNLQVLKYIDRPFYKNDNFILRPFLHLINYFRTLNYYQLASWIFWILVFQFILKNSLSNLYKQHFSIIGVLGGLFLIVLGLYYQSNITGIKGYSKVYKEYSTLLIYIGIPFIIYMLILMYFKYFKKSANI